MPRAPEPFPDGLGRIFTRSAAEQHGVGRQRLRRKDLDHRVYGVRVVDGTVDDLATRCRAFAERLGPGVFVSHSTAAQLWGMPLPRRLERMSRVHMSIEAPTRAPHATGLIGHSRHVADGDIVDHRGLRISSPARMWCEMASALDILDLVAVTDALIHRTTGRTDASALGDRLAVRDRIARARLLPLALELSSDRAESPPESKLRVICVWAGLPSPSVNHELVDTETGRRLRLDLAWADRKFAIEYQGDYHRTKEQWRRDMTRRENLRLSGWTILELNAEDLRDVTRLAARIRSGLARG